MDLNHLIHRQGEERLRARDAACRPSRLAHLGLANLYRDVIDDRRRALFAGANADVAGVAPRL